MVAQSGPQVADNCRDWYRNRTSWGTGICLKVVRTQFEIGSWYGTARLAWDNNEHRHAFTGFDDIPYMAPVWSQGPNPAGHVFIAGGRFKAGSGGNAGKRICWTTDQFGDGRFTPVPPAFISDYWGQEILGWSRSLNGVKIPYLFGKDETGQHEGTHHPHEMERLIHWRDELRKAQTRAAHHDRERQVRNIEFRIVRVKAAIERTRNR